MIKEVPRKKNPRPQRKRVEEQKKQRKRFEEQGDAVQIAEKVPLTALETLAEMEAKIEEKP